LNGLKYFIYGDSKYASIVGFMYPFKNKEIIFKTKDLSIKRRNNTGAKCDSAGKANIVKLLNRVGIDTSTLDEQIMLVGTCGIAEILMRYYTEINKNGKVWFLSLENAILNSIETKRFL
jgi:hypothetical protein